MRPYKPRTTQSRRFPFLHKTAQRRQHLETALDAIKQRGQVTAKLLHTDFGIPKDKAQRVLRELEASGHHVPSDLRLRIVEGLRRKKQSGIIVRRRERDPAIEQRRKSMLELMIDFGLERRLFTIPDLAKALAFPADVVFADINYFKDHSPEIRRNPELRELVDLTMLKTKIYEDPKVTNEQLEDVLGLSNNTLASRLSRLRQVDPETTKYRIIPKTELSATSIDARTETMQRFVRGEISREDTLKQTSLGNDAFIKLLSRIRKRMGVSIISQEELERRKVVRQLVEGKITREDALEKTGLSPVNLKSRVYELRKKLGKRSRADRK